MNAVSDAARLPEAGAELTPLRISRDHSHLVVIDGDGNEYTIPLGQQLQTQPSQTHPSQTQNSPTQHTQTSHSEQKVETPMTSGPTESALRPRDIQQRIRAGESVEHVADVAGTSVDRVMVYASPVLAEREHIASTALTASVRRRASDPETTERTLGVSTELRLREAGLDPETAITWDAWRRADGKWALVATYDHGRERRAEFTFDVRGRFVVPDSDEARWLVGDGHFDAITHAEVAVLGDDAIDLVHADADWIGTSPVVSAPEPTITPAPPVVEEATPEPQLIQPEPPRSRRKGRSSVPSWDEIMFGGPQD